MFGVSLERKENEMSIWKRLSRKGEEKETGRAKGKYTCGKCGLSGDIMPGRLGFGQCPKCGRVLCSNCYVKAMGEPFPGMMAIVNQCPDCRQMLKPPPGI